MDNTIQKITRSKAPTLQSFMYCYVESYKWMARQTFLCHTWRWLIWSRASKQKRCLRNVWNWSQNDALSYSRRVQSPGAFIFSSVHGWETKISTETHTVLADTGNTFSSLVNNQLDAQLLYFIILLLQSSTYFEQRRAHHHQKVN